MRRLERAIAECPVASILGARQVGKSTLARQLLSKTSTASHYFDLEDPRDRAALGDPIGTLGKLGGLIVLDEVQRMPELFPILRVLADRPKAPAQFLILGSASPFMIRGVSESLAGRVGFVHLGGFSLEELTVEDCDALWSRGGFPRSFLAPDDAASLRWRENFITTFLERDLAQLGIRIPATRMRRFWTMLAHYHGQVLNASEIGRSMDVSHKTVQHYLDILEGSFMLRRVLPWFENLKKRQIRSPKVYLTDTGLLHALLGIGNHRQLLSHPKAGASWESFAMNQVLSLLNKRPEEVWFWATQGGAELDLLIQTGKGRIGFEFKMGSSPRKTRSMHESLTSLNLERLYVVHGGPKSFPLDEAIQAVALPDLEQELVSLR